jgi:PKD repeat protein
MNKYIWGAVLIVVLVLVGLKIKSVRLSTSDAASGSSVFEQRAKIKHKNVKVGIDKGKFPEIKLAKKESRKQEAIDLLGDRLPQVAAWYELTPEKFKDFLMTDESAWVDEDGKVILRHDSARSTAYQTTNQEVTTMAADGTVITDTGIFPNTQTFLLHSSPNSKKIIYLDFDGYDPSFGAFDMDGDPTSFTTAEHQYIQQVWQMVAEDFLPFDIDVTTEWPGIDKIARLGSTDEEYGTWAIITPTNPPAGIAGQATLSAFYQYSYGGITAKTWTKSYGSSLTKSAKDVGETTSHEVGHTFGFMHKGYIVPGSYYTGHGGIMPPAVTSWGPTMGNPSSKNLIQWSKGEYPNAVGDPYYGMHDEIKLLASIPGYYPDDTGNNISSAKPLAISGSSWSAYGVIEQATDVDVYSFDTTGGNITLTATPAIFGPNLDIKMELLDSQGIVVASDNPETDIKAAITQTLQPGTYYVSIDGVGKPATPTDPGYSDYASLGQYKISGQIAAVVNQDPVAVISATPATGTAPLNVTLNGSQSSDPDGTITSYSWDFGDGTTGTGVSVSHSYTAAGTFVAKLTVSDDKGKSSSSTKSIVASSSTQPPTTIAAPTSLTVSVSKTKAVTLKWADKSSNEEGFYIERAISSKTPSYTKVGEVGANTVQFVQTVPSSTYLYRVQAFNKTTGKVSGYSNTVTARVK